MTDLELAGIQRELESALEELASIPRLTPRLTAEAMRRATIHVRMAELLITGSSPAHIIA